MICDYGCGQEATHQLKNKKWCCSKSCNSCPAQKKINSEKNMGRVISEKTKEKMRESRIGIKDSIETRKRKSIARRGNKNPMFGKIHPSRKTVFDIKKEYPFFCKIEQIRDNKKHEIEVRCKLCKNWFIPTHDQLRYRIAALEKLDGNDGLYFYCSDECKDKCPVYNIKTKRILKNKNTYYTENEYQTFRKIVLERDNYKCQYCEKQAVHVHHERPQKLEPFFALDPDFAWSCCKKCHYEKGHNDKCSIESIRRVECHAR